MRSTRNAALLLLVLFQAALAHNPGSTEIEALTNLLKERPDDVDLLLRRGKLFLFYGDLPDALQDLDHVLEVQPECGQALIQRANIFYLKEEWEKALADLSRVFSLGEGDVETLALKGKVLMKLGRFDQAVNDLDRALEKKEYDIWLADRAAAHEGAGDLEAAEADLARLVEITGGLSGCEALYRLRMRGGDPAGAAEAMDAALRSDDQVPLYHLLRAEARSAAGLPGAGEDFRAALQWLRAIPDPDLWSAGDHVTATRALAGLGRADEALEEIDRARNKAGDGTLLEALETDLRRLLPREAGEDPPPAETSPAPARDASPSVGRILRGRWPAPAASRPGVDDLLVSFLAGLIWVLARASVPLLVFGSALAWSLSLGVSIALGALTAASVVLWTASASAFGPAPGSWAGPDGTVLVLCTAVASALLGWAGGVRVLRGGQAFAPHASPGGRPFIALFHLLAGMAVATPAASLFAGDAAPPAGVRVALGAAFFAGAATVLLASGATGSLLARRFRSQAEGWTIHRTGGVLIVLGAAWMATVELTRLF